MNPCGVVVVVVEEEDEDAVVVVLLLRALTTKLLEDATMIEIRANSSGTILMEEDSCCRDLFLDNDVIAVVAVA